MKLFFSTFFLLFLISMKSIYSFDINNLNNMFQYLRDSSELGGLREEERCCGKDVDEVDLMNQCALDLCGKSGTVDPSRITDKDYEKYYKRDMSKDYLKFKPRLKKYSDIVRKKAREELRSIERKYFKGKKKNLNLEDFDDDEISFFLNDELRKVESIELKEDKRGRRDIKISFDPSFGEIDESIKKKYIEYRKKQLKEDFYEVTSLQYISPQEALDFFEDSLGKLIAEVERQMKEKPSQENKKILKRNQKKKESYEKMKKAILKLRSIPHPEKYIGKAYDYILNIDRDLPQKLKLKYYSSSQKEQSFHCGKICRDFVLKKIKKRMLQRKVTKIFKKLDDPKIVKSQIESCEYLWVKDKLRKAFGNTKEEFYKKIPEILKQVESGYLSLFSKETGERLKKSFKDLSYVAADDPLFHEGLREENLNSFRHFKKKVAGEIRSFQKKMRKERRKRRRKVRGKSTEGEESQWRNLFDDYRILGSYFRGEGEEIHIPTELDICSEVTLTGFQDRRLGSDDYFYKNEKSKFRPYIYISSASCSYYTTGKQAFAHEIGHAINDEFLRGRVSELSFKKYSKTRECVGKRYKDRTFAGTPRKGRRWMRGDSKYTEEDMADFISAVVFRDSDSPLFSCSLLSKDKNGIDYDKLDLSVLNTIPNDNHSSSFLRLLEEAILKDKILTPSCRSIIERYKDKINFNKCEF